MLLLAALFTVIHGFALSANPGRDFLTNDQLKPLSPGAVIIKGYLGRRIDQCIHNRIMVQDMESMIDISKRRCSVNRQGIIFE